MTYAEQMKDPRWRIKSAKIVERDNGRCRDCNSTENLQVHHCYYIPGLLAWEHEDDLLITVCPNCHRFRQEREQAAFVAMARIFRVVSPKRIETWAWSMLAQAILEVGHD